MRKLSVILFTAPLVLASGMCAQAQPDAPGIEPPRLYEEVLVTGGRDAIRTLPGSATFIDREAIAQFDVTDINDLLTQVPGVYIRFEDGYGLRPNIGIRGATAERSQKITLMEDGILIAPAPYSAPAAYYLPNVNRMAAVEVFKGPASVQYGPHTVGGALNLVTPQIPEESAGEASLTYGTNNYHKARLLYGSSGEAMSFLVDALTYGADGFKELDTGGDTGFARNDLNAKLRWRSADSASIDQTFAIKLGYADEKSDETYLGLTDEDFEENPVRRYAASELDEFNSEHTQVHALHTVDFENGWSFVTRAYVNRFDRAWNKFDGFLGLNAAAVLGNPDVFHTRMAIIRGEQDSDGSPEQTLDLTNNAREYGSQGVDLSGQYRWTLGDWQHNLEAGVRYHHDFVERDHQVRGYLMQDGHLAFDGVTDRLNKVLNKAETDATAAYISDEIVVGNWRVNLGLRAEQIEGELTDDLAGAVHSNTETALIPGMGLFYQLTPQLGLLVGVNEGFSPNGPGVSEDVEPEKSLNYEYGLRFEAGELSAEAIGFFSDYTNLLGRCRVSDAGCEVGEEFNGGNVEIAGLEFTADYAVRLTRSLIAPFKVVYTYTESAFQSSFRSGFSQWGWVNEGDELPYMPEHQGRFLTGLSAPNWSLDLAVNYVGATRNKPGQGALVEGDSMDALTTLDLVGAWHLRDQVTLRLVSSNITDEQKIISRKPFGARPNQPRQIKLGATYRF